MANFFLLSVLLTFVLGSCKEPIQFDHSISLEVENKLQSLYDSSRILETSDIKGSLGLVYELEERVNELDDQNWKAKVLIQLGRLYFYSGLIDIATSHYLEAKELLKDQPVITKNNLDVLIGLGSIKHLMGAHEEALSYYLEANALLRPEQDFYVMTLGSVCNNLGSVYILLNDYEKADSVINAGIDFLLVSDPDNSNLRKLYNNLGRMHQSMEKYDQAFLNYEKSTKLCESSNDFNGLALIGIFIGSTFQQQGEYVQAVNNYRRSFQLCDSLGFTANAYNSSLVLVELYYQINMPDSALYFAALNEKLKEKLGIEQASKKLISDEVSSLYLQKEKDLKEKIGSFEWSLTLFLILVSMALAVVVIFYLRFRENQRNRVLNKFHQKLTLEKLEFEKSKKLSELKSMEEELGKTISYDLKKNELLQNLTQKLLVARLFSGEENPRVLKGLFKSNGNKQEEKLFEEFELIFCNLDPVFFDRLTKNFPELTAQERRLCGLIRLKLDNNEIAAISGKTVSTLHVSKSRLKKKLGLSDSSQSLEDFLVDY